MVRGPVEVQAACGAALVELSGAFATTAVAGSLEQWAGVLASAQRVVNAASAVQDAAIARLAAIEPEFLEDGTVVECHRGLGHVALDAPAIVSGVLATSAVHSQRRVRTAARLAADGPAGSETATGLGGLHAAMASGRLDGYRAAVVAEELEHAPAEVAATVVAALEGHFETEDGAHLRRRCRRVLARISPDLLHQRAARARAKCGLRRWADEPGVDRWEGTFPSEEAARAWAAIDALARQYVTDGVCSGIERARAKALTDLVAGNATIDTVITITVPAAALTEPEVPEVPTTGGASAVAEPAAPQAPETPVGIVNAGERALVEVTGPGAGEPVLISHQWLTDTLNSASAVQ